MKVLFSISTAAGVEGVAIFSARATGPTPAASTEASRVVGRAEMVFIPRARRREVVRREVFMIASFWGVWSGWGMVEELKICWILLGKIGEGVVL